MDTRECSECRRERPSHDFEWTYDRYGIPWRKVCYRCVPKAEAEIAGWIFDPADAGESLEPDA